MKSLRNVIISGAGAVIPWGAPKTMDLTDLLIKDKVFVNDNNETIGSFLFKKLKEKLIYPNFETILHFIEYLYQVKIPRYEINNSNFDFSDFFILDNSILNELELFENSPINKRKTFYRSYLIDTALGKNKLIDNKFFYSELYLHFIYLIKEEIKKYDCNKTIENTAYEQVNKDFDKFIKSIKADKNIIRYYTLNYDYLPLKLSSIKLFDGYDEEGNIDKRKIIKSTNIDCYYHLHGSNELNLLGKKSSQNMGTKNQEDFNQNEMIYSPIISGFNKLDRIHSEPFRHFNNQLIIDCYKADVLYIIGYSFGDMHINNAINCTMQKGRTKIVYVDFIKNFEYDSIESLNSKFHHSQPLDDYIPPYPIENYSYISNKLELHLKGFEEYLKCFNE
jgi:hypothetical protein